MESILDRLRRNLAVDTQTRLMKPGENGYQEGKEITEYRLAERLRSVSDKQTRGGVPLSQRVVESIAQRVRPRRWWYRLM